MRKSALVKLISGFESQYPDGIPDSVKDIYLKLLDKYEKVCKEDEV